MIETNIAVLEDLEKLRKEIHQNPELSQHEYETARRIKDYLVENSSAEVRYIAKTGVLATFDSKKPGKTLLLRADTDALPIAEINEFGHRSTVQGVSHKCGHDGHTVMMLGVAHLMSSFDLNSGKVLLLFQPAEENGMGAEAVLKDELFLKEKIDYVFALHNLPGFPKKQIIIKENVFNANVKSLIVHLNGKTSHAAEPE
ncbi:MAG: amidohydrolase, partial [Bacteroidia bacterium]|nr:amidohydrolase [Bacteroidia bacterium]